MNIQIIGAGSWGLALARLLANNGHAVRIWGRQEDGLDELAATRQSPVFLPGVKLPESVTVSHELDAGAELAVLAQPSHVMRKAVAAHSLSPRTIRVNVAKGIENGTLMRMSEVIHDVCGDCPVVTLSGPSHAEEVGKDLPASVVAAGQDEAARTTVQDAFNSGTFRVYTSSDIVGVELGGSLKNVIAIAAGVCDGLGFGENARAALITRGLAEISRLGVALGADPLTFSGLSGMGDLIVTCSSDLSRNHAVGRRIAEGQSAKDAEAASPMVAEGVRTAKSAMALSARTGVELPIAEQVYRLLFENASPKEAVQALMLRETKPERG